MYELSQINGNRNGDSLRDGTVLVTERSPGVDITVYQVKFTKPTLSSISERHVLK